MESKTLTTPDTTTTDELEEAFAQEIPCGGIRTRPVAGPCPDKAAAKLVQAACGCRAPQSFKCYKCHARWLRGVIELSSRLRCKSCGLDVPISEAWTAYREL